MSLASSLHFGIGELTHVGIARHLLRGGDVGLAGLIGVVQRRPQARSRHVRG